MRYANLSTKRITGMVLAMGILAAVVSVTAVTWANAIGTFSIPAVELQFSNAAYAWQYRLEYNLQFGAKATPGIRSLLAMIGLVPPAIASPTADGTQAAPAIPVLLYHGILPTSNSSDVTTIQNFKDQMFALKNAGWQTITIEQFVAAMQGKTTLPPKSFLLTFDDGRQDAYYNATPILKALGYNAVMYVITGHSLTSNNAQSKYYLTEDQLQQMVASGIWELQSHSDIGHAQYPVNASGTLGDFFGNELWIPTQDPGESSSSYASRVSADLTEYFDKGTLWPLTPGRSETEAEYESRIKTDLTNAKDLLTNKLGVNVLSFAYPYNDFAKDLENDAQGGTSALVSFVNQIYPVSFYQWYPSLGFSENYPGADGQLLKRIEPQPNWTPDYLLSLLDNGQTKSLPYTLNSVSNDGWSQAWGSVTYANGSLKLAASTSTAGASTILDGTRLWTNYDYEVGFNWQTSESVSLIGRYEADPQATNYIACNFADGSARLEDHENGSTTVIAEKNDASISSGNGENAGIEFTGNYAECLWNGGVVAGGNLPSSAPSSGGVGIEVWNAKLDDATITVNNITVK